MSSPVNEDFEFLFKEIHRMHDEIREDLGKIRDELVRQGKEIAGLKVKAGAWGMVAGCIPVFLMGTWLFLKQLVAGDGT